VISVTFLVDQYLAHDVGRIGEKVRALLGGDLALADDLDRCAVDEFGWCDVLAGAVAGEYLAGEDAQLVIDVRQHPVTVACRHGRDGEFRFIAHGCALFDFPGSIGALEAP
jgi:hypothetical protein